LGIPEIEIHRDTSTNRKHSFISITNYIPKITEA
jgi:hypothetical protein